MIGDDDDVERGIKFVLFCLIQELIKRELKLKQLITRSKLKVNKEYKKSSVNEGWCVCVGQVVSHGMRAREFYFIFSCCKKKTHLKCG